MSKIEKPLTKRQKIERTAVVLFCAVLTVCVALVLLLLYNPTQNALGALGTTCMDVICIIVLDVLAIGIVHEKDENSKTTGWFLALLLATIWALFWDFMVWSADGSLAFRDYTNVFTILSLCMGSILAGIFVFYLSSYMYDMYDLKGAFRSAKVCMALNLISCVTTFSLALMQQAFNYEDGHYVTGTLYEFVTIVPILTLLYMTGYAVKHVKLIGVHDIHAVGGYILIMIVGALVESVYSIGTSYVGVTIADVYIFIMLQNKLIGRVKKQKEMLAEKIADQYAILESMAGIYAYVNYVDLEERTAQRFDREGSSKEPIDMEGNPHTALNQGVFVGITEEHRERFWLFTELTTLSIRMMGEKMITEEFCHKVDGWFRAQYIRIGNDLNAPVKQVVYTIRNIDEEKKNLEKWIRKSNTDELTGLLNRNAYEDEVAALATEKLNDNFVVVSIDLNGLKVANDNFGHDAGDELLVGTANSIKQCFGAYGKVFRTGGDEFVAFIFADEKQLAEILKDFEEVVAGWKGTYETKLALSCGYATKAEAENLTLHEISKLADKRMYQDKALYYSRTGNDRRGNRTESVDM